MRSANAGSLALVASRVCRRALPDACAVRVSELAAGEGVHIWLDGAPAPAASGWAALHRLQRQLQLLGLHVELERDARGLLVLGWSVPSLMHRARQLRSALDHRLSDFQTTAHVAVAHAAELCARLNDGGDDDALLVAQTCAFVCEQLRWPGLLADLDGWMRHSDLPEHQVLLAQIIGLEAKIAHRCAEHLVYARLLATSACRLARSGDLHRAQQRVLTAAAPWLRAGELLAQRAVHGGDPLPLVAGGPVASLTDRLIAVSVPNHGRAPSWTGPRWS
ncbi:hypothetical protein [Nonomuraea turcica]|uniref:hypothetical protein n=1 Tax=Nonomuraea sp. G32 TaxID=3067274 RepID=UPI00273C555A|nr:hypothetical protein [Nonomuraea sp. G32]MDP4511828.1 hypothetical protein [Nonomuraea sp. G32]